MSGTVKLKPGREKSVLQRHPWIFSGAIASAEGCENGDVVDVVSSKGEWLARGSYNRKSQITVRILTWDMDEKIGLDFWVDRIERAFSAREGLWVSDDTEAFRVVHAESDYLPGLVVDVYGRWLVVQFLTLGVEKFRTEILKALQEVFPGMKGIVDRSDVSIRKKEGLGLRKEIAVGEPPPTPLEFLENGHRFLADLLGGQKTGFYLDQRENRALIGNYAHGMRVLNAFSYTGAFGVYALKNGAEFVTNLDSVQSALDMAAQNLKLNGFGELDFELVRGDAFEVLREFLKQGRTFDMVILDPPKFATNQRNLQPATRGYKDINMLGMKLLRPGGLLATFSCSGLVSPDLFQKIVFGASIDAKRDAQIIEEMSQGCDHPVALTFPQGAYLKGLLLRVW